MIPAIEKVIQRAITDYDDIIIEGVHLVPGLIDTEQFEDDKKGRSDTQGRKAAGFL